MQEDILNVLIKTNQQMGGLVDDNLLTSILILVKRNPLNDDRSICQDQIEYLIKQIKGESTI